ncbi:MAG: hypothetical protein SGBAC_010223 [Bacillariaceae sp.]
MGQSVTIKISDVRLGTCKGTSTEFDFRLETCTVESVLVDFPWMLPMPLPLLSPADEELIDDNGVNADDSAPFQRLSDGSIEIDDATEAAKRWDPLVWYGVKSNTDSDSSLMDSKIVNRLIEEVRYAGEASLTCSPASCHRLSLPTSLFAVVLSSKSPSLAVKEDTMLCGSGGGTDLL